MDLLFFLKALYRKKWIILLLSFLASVAAFFFLVNKKPFFDSVAQYSTGFTTEKVKLADGSSSVDIYTIDIKFDNVIETMKSPPVINRISYQLLLHDLVDTAKAYHKLTNKQMNSPIYREVNKDTAKRILLTKLANNEQLRTDVRSEVFLTEYLKLYGYDYFGLVSNFIVQRVANTDYLNIIYRSENPYLSAYIVNAAGREFLNYYRSLNTQRTDTNSLRIQELLKIQKGKVDTLNQQLLKVKGGTTIDPAALNTSLLNIVTELESSRAEETGKYNEHANRVSYLRKNLDTYQTQYNSSGSTEDVVRLTNRKNDLVAQLNAKGGNDPALEKQISDLRIEIASKSGSAGSRTRLKENIDKLSIEISEEEALMNAAKTSIADYSRRINEYKSRTGGDASSQVMGDIISTKLDMENKELANLMARSSGTVALAKDDPTSNFIQTRVGEPAIEPESKKTFMKMVLSGVSVFFLSSVVFLFLQIFDSSIKTPTFFNRSSKIKAAAVLNMVKLKGEPITSVVTDEHEGKKFLNKNVFKNNIRKLRFELLKSGKQAFLFTSTQTNAGKTSVIEALAASLLMSDKKVLLMDLNFTNNSITDKYAPNVFIEDLDERKVNASSTDRQGLFVLGCRKGNKTPAEALSGVNLPAILELLKKQYDFILMEGAALNFYADSKELSQFAEAVFIVFAADSAITEVDHESMKFISDLKEKNHGVILNKVLTENINS